MLGSWNLPPEVGSDYATVPWAFGSLIVISRISPRIRMDIIFQFTTSHKHIASHRMTSQPTTSHNHTGPQPHSIPSHPIASHHFTSDHIDMTSHQITSHDPTSHLITAQHITSHHIQHITWHDMTSSKQTHYSTSPGGWYTQKNWFGQRTGWRPCAHFKYRQSLSLAYGFFPLKVTPPLVEALLVARNIATW